MMNYLSRPHACHAVNKKIIKQIYKRHGRRLKPFHCRRAVDIVSAIVKVETLIVMFQLFSIIFTKLKHCFPAAFDSTPHQYQSLPLRRHSLREILFPQYHIHYSLPIEDPSSTVPLASWCQAIGQLAVVNRAEWRRVRLVRVAHTAHGTRHE